MSERAGDSVGDTTPWAVQLERIERAETVARRFHEEYEALAPHYGYETRVESRVAWPDVPEHNRDLMIAVVVALLRDGTIQ